MKSNHRWVRATTLALCICIGWAGAVSAQEDEEDYARVGTYIRGGYAGAEENSADLDRAAALVGGTQETMTSNGFAVAAGYRMLTHLAFEVAFEYFPATQVSVTAPGIGTQGVVDRRVLDVTANLRAYPFTGRFQPYGTFGLGMASIDQTVLRSVPGFAGATDEGSGLVFRFGGGLEYYLSGRHALYVDGSYMVTTGAIEGNDWGTFGAGLTTRF